MSREHVLDDIPAYALGGLEPDEAAVVAEHLSGCEACREELTRYLPLRFALDVGAPDTALPEGSKERLLSRGARDPLRGYPEAPLVSVPPPVQAVPTPLPIPASSRRLGSGRAPWALAAASVVLAVGLGVGAYHANEEAGQYRAAADEKQQTIDAVVDLMERADLRVQDLPPAASGTRTRVYEAREGDVGMVVFDRLPPLPQGRVYQLWMGSEGRLRSEGTFEPTEEGSYHKLLKPPDGFAQYEAIAVAPVPSGGVATPPTEGLVVEGDL